MYVTCKIGRGSYWSWFSVNPPTSHKDMRKNDFHVFVPMQWPWPFTFWPQNLLSKLLVSRITFPLN